MICCPRIFSKNRFENYWCILFILNISITHSKNTKNLKITIAYTDTGTQNRCLLHRPYCNRGILLEIKCLKSATRLLNRVCVGQRGLDLSILPYSPERVSQSRTRPRGRIFFKPPTLPAGNLAAL